MPDQPTSTPLSRYTHRVLPYPHQVEALERSWRKVAFALFMDPGLGKTKVTIDTAALLFGIGYIKALVVLAPNDVHEQWLVEQLPTHLPPHIKTRTLLWRSSRSVRLLKELKQIVRRPDLDALHVLSLNHESLTSAPVRKVLRAFMGALPSMLVLDESHAFKTPKAQRTRAVTDLAPLAKVRRLLTGTPSDGNPFDLYAQYNILNPKITGFDSFLAFKHRYGEWSKGVVRVPSKTDPTKVTLREYPQFEGYRNVQELFDRVAPFTYIKKKADCLGMPPKVYSRLPTHLSPNQRALQDELLARGMVLLRKADDPRAATALVRELESIDDEELAEIVMDPNCRMTQKIKLTVILRLMQCSAGVVSDDAKQSRLVEAKWDKIPRAALTVDHVVRALANDPSEKIIVWAHFKPALLMLEEALRAALPKHGAQVVRVDGTVKGAARAAAVQEFKNPRSTVRALVAHPRTMGVGMNFGVAGSAIFYTNGFSSIDRTQAEDRIDRLDNVGTRTIIDLVARDSMTDAKILSIHKQKGNFGRAFDALSADAFEKELRTHVDLDT